MMWIISLFIIFATAAAAAAKHGSLPPHPTASANGLIESSSTKSTTKAVFAHFMVDNVGSWTREDWENEIKLAQAAHIDAFALNMAYSQEPNSQIDTAFLAAGTLGFKLFFSFDYAGNGPWPREVVINRTNLGAASTSYWTYQGKPLVSTFEGPANADDWVEIKAETGCFLIPDWSSLGAEAALNIGIADGLFNWAAWPWGPHDMNTYVDASYLQFLKDKPYMMPVSPWFFTNMPGYDKNWLWRGDDLWYDRWQEVIFIQPDFVEIISWNDYGESHYIGPLHDKEYVAFGNDTGAAPFNYALNMPHDGWRLFLPFVIDSYKYGQGSVDREGVVAWYRLTPGTACATGGTTGNTARQLEIEFPPSKIVQDKIFYSALLVSSAQVTVTVGGTAIPADWTNTPSGAVGIYHGSVAFGRLTGPVVVTISRAGATIAQMTGESIILDCPDPVMNWNAWVGSATGPTLASTQLGPDISNHTCIQGTAIGNFQGLCEFTCSLGYCPLGACLCLAMGPAPKLPPSTGIKGYPTAGESADYSGLCSFACNYGYCPSSVCGTVQVPLTIPTVSPFLPPACTAGSGEDHWIGLCSFSCGFGYCPMAICNCTETGALVQAPPLNNTADAVYLYEENADDGLCQFACQHGYCPDTACASGEGAIPSCDMDNPDPSCEGDVDYVCDPTLVFETFADLQRASGSYPDSCADQYSLQVLLNMLKQTMANYTSANDGYDHKFKYYVQYIKDMVPSTISSFMELPGGPGNKYFTCDFENPFDKVQTMNCSAISASLVSEFAWTITYRLVDSAGFYNDLETNYGINSSWVEFTNVTNKYKSCTKDPRIVCHDIDRKQIGIPAAVPAAQIDVPNPKDTVTKAQPDINTLQAVLSSTYLGIAFGSWNGSDDDASQVLSMPVFMLSQAVQSMQQVDIVGGEVEKEKKKELILTITSAILFFLPFAGELGELAFGVSWVLRAIDIAGFVGNDVLSIVDIIDDPTSAPLAILGMLMTPAARDPEHFAAAAAERRAMRADGIAKLGNQFKENDDAFQSIVKACRP